MNELGREGKTTEQSHNESGADEINTLATVLSHLSMTMNKKPPKLESLDRAKVQQFVKDYEDYQAMGGLKEIKDLLEPGLLIFLSYSANATSNACILSELKNIVQPQSVSAFEDVFEKVKLDMDEPDGVRKIQKLFAAFEIALQKTNLVAVAGSPGGKYALSEKKQRKMLLGKLPEPFQECVRAELRYRDVETKPQLYEIVSELAKSWDWSTAPRATSSRPVVSDSRTVSLPSVRSRATSSRQDLSDSPTLQLPSTGTTENLHRVREAEILKQRQRAITRSKQLLNQ